MTRLVAAGFVAIAGIAFAGCSTVEQSFQEMRAEPPKIVAFHADLVEMINCVTRKYVDQGWAPTTTMVGETATMTFFRGSGGIPEQEAQFTSQTAEVRDSGLMGDRTDAVVEAVKQCDEKLVGG